MTSTISYLPLYDQYFDHPSPQQNEAVSPIRNWEQFQSPDSDWTTALSERPADLIIHPTLWQKTQQMVATTAKIALFSYMIHPLLGWAVTPPVTALVSLIPNSIIHTCQGQCVVHALSACGNTLLIEAGKRISAATVKQLVFAGGISIALRYILQRIIMLPLFPAQSRIVKCFYPTVRTHALEAYRKILSDQLQQEGFLIRDVSLEKNGVRYSGLLIGHKETISNGQWALQATGNLEPVEHSAENFARIYRKFDFNTLLVNGPSVGKSQGQATPETMGDAQEVALTFMETALKAKRMVIAGRSLGGAAIGKAIGQHPFKADRQYLVVRQMTFDRVSSICGKVVHRIFSQWEWPVTHLIRFAGCEIDSVAASEKLQDLGIKEVVVQAGHKQVSAGQIPDLHDFQTDGPILANASLGYALVQEGVTENKVFHCLKDAPHMTNEAAEIAREEILALSGNKVKEQDLSPPVQQTPSLSWRARVVLRFKNIFINKPLS